MATLYKRATLSQVRVLRIIEGAIRNASDVHPDQRVSKHMARSIAKRAAGTLTAGWPEVLAARLSRRSDRTAINRCNGRPHGAQSTKRHARGAPRPARRRSPLRQAWTALAYEIGVAKRAGDFERMAALIHAIRIVAAVEKVDLFRLPSKESSMTAPSENQTAPLS